MASGLTSIYFIPYPLSTDPVNVHGDMQSIALQIEDVLYLKPDKNLANIFTKSNTFTLASTDGVVINHSGTGTPLKITNTGSGNSFLVEDAASTDGTPFVIDASGNVGIGKTVPTKLLDVAGAGAFSAALTALTFNGLSLTSNATGFTTSGGTTPVAVTFAGGSAYTLSGTNGQTYTFPTTGGTLTVNPLTTLGDILYGGASGVQTRLAGNTTNGQYFLTENVTASASVAPTWQGSTGTAGSNVVLATSPTISSPTIDSIINTSVSTAATLFNGITTGSITTGGALTTGGINIANGAAFNGTVAIASGAGTVNKIVQIGTSSTSGTTAITLGSSSGATSTIALNGSTTINGDLTINGTTNTLNTNTLTVDDKNIELGSVAAGTISTTGTIGTVSGAGPFTASITGMTSTVGLIPGQVITSTAGTGNFGSGVVTVASVASATSITVSSTLTFTAGTVTNILGQAATDVTANGGGITLKGATDKTITWDGTNWTSNQPWNVTSGNTFKINNTSVLSSTAVLGITPTINATGFALAGGTTSKTLTIQNNITLSGTDGVAINLGGTNGTLGSAAFTASTAYEPAITTLAISKGGTGTGTAPTQYGVIYASSATAYASTAAGTNTQVLIGNAAGAPSWTNISGLSVSSASTATTATNLSGTTVYSIPYQSASGTTSYVAIGAAGQVLAVNGTTNGYTWTTPLTNPMTTLGDLIVGGASGAATRLAGSAVNGTYGLTAVVSASAAVAPTWVLATGTGAPVHASTPTITTPKIDSISTTTGAAATPTLWSDVTTGSIAIGAGITSGTVNIATAGTGTNAINIGNSNSTLTVNGNLTVNGTTTTVNSVTITVDDPNLELNSVASPSDANAAGGGLTIKATNDKSIIWQATATTGNTTNTGYWNLTDNLNLNGSTKAYYINGTSVLSSTVVLGITPTVNATGFSLAGGTTSKSLTVQNNITLSGTDGVAINLGGSSGTLGTGAFATIANYAPLAGATFTGQIQSTLTGVTTNGGGQIYLNGATSNRIDFNINGIAAPAFTTRSTGTKIVLYPSVGATAADYAIGIDNSTLWQSVEQASASHAFKWYGGTTLAATLTGTGALTTTGSVTASSIIRSGGTSAQYLMADGSVTTSVSAAAGSLTGSTLAAGVTASSLTSLGTLTSLTVSGNLTVSGVVTVPTPVNNTDAANKAYVDSVLNAGVPEIIPLDDISGQFNNYTSRFVPRYQGVVQSITNPLRLVLTINGIIQYVDFPDYVWQSPLPREGFQIDNDGFIAFSEVVPAGSRFSATIQPGPNTITKKRQYPFKAVDILLGG